MITDSFDAKSKPIISLSDIYGEQKHIADICIITFSHVITQFVLESESCEKIAEIGSCHGNIPIYLFRCGVEIAFYLSPLGSALASECLLEAWWLTGASKFIVFGSAGSLDYGATANRFVIPTYAYRDEGMSYHYAPPADYIKIKNSDDVRKIFDELRVPYIEGRTWTTDAFLRETAGEAEKRRDEGCISVEMELAGLQAVCDYSGLDLYSFLATGDVLYSDSYSRGALSDANHNVNKFALALEIAKRI